MLRSTSSARLVMITVGSSEEGARIGRMLVEARLAACATLLPGARSIYRWKDKIESSDECMVLLKTAVSCLPALEARLHELHSYETPEFLVIPVESGSDAYLAWIEACVLRPENKLA